ncbi:hypothetical protein LSTR_LSTR007896 [Laodelphax striatellus]|uniref:C2H2-type domain-containing protein n=2 Tax=Laodelphax striatellus TaxID=195883 RepID=A0A482WXR4_LAOST|nr:hypothetical protein LSTR_LSTR007896 [Laodelphax striatellus]
MPESCMLESSQQPVESNMSCGPSYESHLKEEEGDVVLGYQEDPLENDDSSNQIFVCTHCDFKTCQRLAFETHIRQHVQLLFSDKMDSNLANSQNTSCSKNVDTVQGGPNVFKRVIEGSADSELLFSDKMDSNLANSQNTSCSKNVDTVQGGPNVFKRVIEGSADSELLFSDKMDSNLANSQNTSCSKNVDTVQGGPNVFKRVIEGSADSDEQQMEYKCEDEYEEADPKNVDTIQGGNLARVPKREIKLRPKVQVDYKCNEETPPKKKRVRKKEPREIQLFTCGYCDFKCPKTDMMKNHLKTVHAGKPAAERSVAKKTKPEKEPIVCELCGFKCIKMAVMKVHNRSHTGERPFSCSHCDQTFVQNSHLTKHLKRHAGKITLQCKSCDFVCNDPVLLKRHNQQVHRLVKTLQCCHLCEHKFLTASQLQRHLRTHSGERPYSCTVCDYRSAQMDTLKAHFRTHTGEKPYSCAQCEFKCAQLSALRTHQFTHTNEKPFGCDRCDYRCARASNLRRHMERRHVQ